MRLIKSQDSTAHTFMLTFTAPIIYTLRKFIVFSCIYIFEVYLCILSQSQNNNLTQNVVLGVQCPGRPSQLQWRGAAVQEVVGVTAAGATSPQHRCGAAGGPFVPEPRPIHPAPHSPHGFPALPQTPGADRLEDHSLPGQLKRRIFR